MADVAEKFKEAEIVPNIIPNPPKHRLEVKIWMETLKMFRSFVVFRSILKVILWSLGTNWAREKWDSAQELRSNLIPKPFTLLLWSVIFINLFFLKLCVFYFPWTSDPDNLSREKPTVAEWLHWLVTNIPASNLLEGILGGQQVMAYGSPVPGPRTGIHRYVILLWEHAGRRIAAPTPGQRAKFKVKAFQEKHNLGQFFQLSQHTCAHFEVNVFFRRPDCWQLFRGSKRRMSKIGYYSFKCKDDCR